MRTALIIVALLSCAPALAQPVRFAVEGRPDEV